MSKKKNYKKKRRPDTEISFRRIHPPRDLEVAAGIDDDGLDVISVTVNGRPLHMAPDEALAVTKMNPPFKLSHSSLGEFFVEKDLFESMTPCILEALEVLREHHRKKEDE